MKKLYKINFFNYSLKTFFFILLLILLIPNIAISTYNYQDIEFIRNSFLEQLTDQEKKWLHKHKQIVFGANPNWHPIEFTENKTHMGIAADYIELIEKILNINIEVITDINWQIILEKARNKEIDGITCIAENSERKQYYIFTRPYYVCPYALVTNQEKHDIRDIDSLTNKTVSVEKNYYLDYELSNKHPTINKYYTKSTFEAIKAVDEKKAEAYIGNLLVINYYIKYYNFNNIIIKQLSPFPETNLHIAVRNDWPDLQSIINKAINLIPTHYHNQINNVWNEYIGKKVALPSIYIDWINKHKHIKLACDPCRFPIEFFDNNKLNGISADYINIISKRHNLTIEPLITDSWKESIKLGEQRKIDMFSSMNVTPERKKLYFFTQPYISFPIVISVNEQSLFISNLKDLKYHKAAIVEKKNFIEDIKKNYPMISLVFTKNLINALDLLIKKKVDAVIGNYASIKYYCAQQGIESVKTAGPTPYKDEARFAIRKDWPEFAEILNHTLTYISNSEKLTIHNKWTKKKFDYFMFWNYFWKIISISGLSILFIIILILLWNRNLRIEIARRKKIENILTNSESKLSQIISFLPDPTWVINNTGEIVAWNRAIEKLTGNLSEEMIGKKDYYHSIPFSKIQEPMLIDIVNTWNKEDESKYSFFQIEDDTISAEKFYPYIKNGLYLREIACPLYDISNKIIGAIESIHDITEQTKTETALRRAKIEAESANEAKSNFLSTMSHEIRTPMNAIIGMTHLALDTELNEKQHNYLKGIQNSANSLLRIINDILDFSRIESGKLEIENIPFNLKSLINDVYETIKHDISKKNLSYKVIIKENVIHSLIGDPLRVKQILLNLITNSIKFTKKGSIRLIVEKIEQKIKENYVLLKFSVKDTGVGISKNQINNIFMPFTQSDSSITRKFGGSGLGLAICKSLTDLMGGNIGVKSEQNISTTFYFNIPFLIQDAHVSDNKSLCKTIESNNKNINNNKFLKFKNQILVVEDNEINQEIVKELLEKKGFGVKIAGNGKEAVDLLENKPIDLILMDIQMPVMNGFEAAKCIKANKDIKDIPLIAMTAHAFSTDQQKCIDSGMDDIICKPIIPNQLYSIINKWLLQSLQLDVKSNYNNLDNNENYVKGWPEIPGISVYNGISRVDGNSELYKNILQLFVDNHNSIDMSIKQDIITDNFNSAIHKLHSFKNIAVSIGADGLYDIINKIVQSLNNNNSKEKILDLLESVNNEIDNVVNSIKKMNNIKEPETIADKSNEKRNIDIELIKPVIEDLYRSVKEFNMNALEYMMQLKQILTDSYFLDNMEELEKYIRNYDYDNCIIILNNIIKQIGIKINYLQ